MNTCSEVEHVEVRGEVVSDVPSGQMVQVGLMKKLPTISVLTEKSHMIFSLGIKVLRETEYNKYFLHS